MIRARFAVGGFLAVCLACSSPAAASLLLRQQLTCMSIMEGWQTILWGIQESGGYQAGAQLGFNLTYSTSGATFTLNPGQQLLGEALSLTGSGTLTGAPGSNLAWSGAWSGAWGPDTFSVTDTGAWLYNGQSGGYSGLDFDQDVTPDGKRVSKVKRAIIRALEAVGVIVTGFVTKDLKNTLTAGSTAVEISNLVLRFLDKGDLPKDIVRPELPLTPPVLGPHVMLLDGAGTFDVALNASALPFETHGTWNNGAASGLTQITPEPGSLLLLGLGAMALTRRRRK